MKSAPQEFEIIHHIDNVVDPYARKRGIDEFAVVTEDVLEMKLRAVVRADGGGEASARYRGRSAGGASLGHLDERRRRLSAHSNAAMVPAAPPPTISTSVW